MKLLLTWLVCLFFICSAQAQNTSWFYGTWTGETYFPNGPITKRIIIKLHVTSVSGNNFTATMDNLFPSDTIVRLERDVKGNIANKNFIITSNEQTYIRDLRTQNFWYDCTACQTQATFAINSNKVEIKISTVNCGDVCNGETVFRRDTSSLDSSQKKQLAKWLGLPAANITAKPTKKTKDTIAMAAAKPIVSPPKKDTVAIKPLVKTEVPKPAKKDTLQVAAITKNTVKKDTVITPVVPKKDTTEDVLKTRTTNLITTYKVSSPHIIIQLFDNAEIDGDMVSVFHNGKLLAEHQSLTHKAITFTIDATKENSHHEFVMVAENLGLIPPNTALMRITAGSQKFEIEISSDFDNNAKITVDYTGE